MASADDVLNEIEVVFSDVETNQTEIDKTSSSMEGTGTRISQMQATAEELSNQSQQMGYEDKVATIHMAMEKANEAQNQLNSARQTLTTVKGVIGSATQALREAQTYILSLKNLLSSALPRGPTPTASTPATRQPTVTSQDRAKPQASDATRLGEAAQAHTGPPIVELPRYPHQTIQTVSADALDHICYGDPLDRHAGGHLFGVKRPEKTEFPKDWDFDMVEKSVNDVARFPDDVRFNQDDDKSWYAYGERDGVKVVVVVEPTGRIKAAWPKEDRKRGVYRNPPE